jgi:pimeloyl-ACP methyl ester carboxylesterase
VDVGGPDEEVVQACAAWLPRATEQPQSERALGGAQHAVISRDRRPRIESDSVPQVGEWTLRQRFDTGAGAIAWDSFGQGPPVVLVHGTPWSSWTWRRLAPELAERFTVYVFDLLGFGASDKRDGQDVSLAAHGQRLALLLDFWALERPALVAHDIGGAAALRAHLLHHRPVASLALVDVVALAPWGTPFYRLVHEHQQVFEQLPAAIHEGLLRAYVATAQPTPLDRDLESALIAPWLGAAEQSAFYRQIAQGDQRDTDEIEPLYGEITAPTLVVWGEADPWLPVAQGRELARRIPRARLEVLREAGHLVAEDAPAALARLVGEHLRTHAG